MKKLIFAMSLLVSISFISCSGNESKEGGDGAAKNETASADKKASAVINEAEWEVRELGGTSPNYNVPSFSMKLPKDAKVEKDTMLENNLKITFSNNYKLVLYYSPIMLSQDWKIADQIADKRKSDIGVNLPEYEIKVIEDNANGYIYSSHMKGAKTGPVGHFTFFMPDKNKGYIQIKDFCDFIDEEEEAAICSEANTKKIFDIIAGSAKFN
jgi:hypothetical protein